MKNNRLHKNPPRQTANHKRKPQRTPQRKPQRKTPTVWLYGTHAVLAALANPNRHNLKLYTTPETLKRLETHNSLKHLKTPIPTPQTLNPKQLAKLVPQDAVHQGIVLQTRPLEKIQLNDFLNTLNNPQTTHTIIALDHINDPHNLGAITRSASVLNASALLSTHRHSPQETGSLAKSASGTLETIPHISVANLAQALKTLSQHNFFICVLTSNTSNTSNTNNSNNSNNPSNARNKKPIPLHQATKIAGKRVVLVLGAEGKGVRPLVAQHADTLAYIPSTAPVQELNVSNAAAIALYSFQNTHNNP